MNVSKKLIIALIVLAGIWMLAGLITYRMVWNPIPGQMAFYTAKSRSCLVEARGLFQKCYSLHHFLDVGPDENEVAYSQVSTPFRVAYINGQENRPLTEVVSTPYTLKWSPNGQHIAYTNEITSSSTTICVVNSDGSNDKCFETGLDYAYVSSWSPDSEEIAFVGRNLDDRYFSIYLVNSDGTNLRLLTEKGDNPSWSPDEERIAFNSNRTGNEEIYVIDIDGTGLVQLTHYPEDDAIPVWSPDGSQIAFLSDRENKSVMINLFDEIRKLSIYIMNPDGSNVRKLLSIPGQSIEYFVWH